MPPDNTPDDVDTSKAIRIALLPGWVDWALKSIIVGLISGTVTVVTWGLSVDARVNELEAYKERVIVLEKKDDAYRELVTGVAVMRSQLDTQGKQLDRILSRIDAKNSVP